MYRETNKDERGVKMSPKAKIEFNLPEESDDYTLATHASDMYCMLHDIKNHLRHYRKYVDFTVPEVAGLKRKSKVASNAIEFFFNKLDNEILELLKDMPEVS